MSLEKLSEKILGVKVPLMLTPKEWGNWHEKIKQERPVRYWLYKTGISSIEAFVMWIPRRINDIMYYIKNRFILKSHALTADKKYLPRGQWCDVGDRFLPCLFSEFVKFVEEEADLDHLRESAKYSGHNNFYLDDNAKAAIEILDLYGWYKEIRPNRPDPDEISGWSAYCEKHPFDILSWENKSKKSREEGNRAIKRLRKIEKQYLDEDEKMLIRLIKIRHSLWV